MNNPEELKAAQIRWADEHDLCELVLLENECFDTYYREHRFRKGNFLHYLQNKRAIFFVAILNASLTGYVAGSVRISRSELSAHLDSIAVLVKLRRKGIGSKLLEQFVKEAKGMDCTKVILQVAVVNENGIRFFARQGLQKIRYLPAYYGRGLDGVLMKLDI